ncbi:cobalt-precorrin-6A reductase [Skermania sp. ID1734]|uniref:cobalt-precorrin-6A reductase n=1 Tax=Skermania sp. ID1734 TaxID=2597516 RepID=UPI001181196A|nr:cobalt-precorrin-6A reductase [Skermania sp. ID1734]TSE01636.1 cobalt-precorrin-6A reductase [Skermania sp. ID1734]
MKVLILGGTREGRELAEILSGERGFDIVSSLAGRVRDPVLPLGAVRVGGFGGTEGLRDWLRVNSIDAVVDATHPFAERITANIIAAAGDRPLLLLRRPQWRPGEGDDWIEVDSLAEAAAAVRRFRRVLLTIGRQGVGNFAAVDNVWFLIRSIDAPDGPLPPQHELLSSRGPFTVDGELELMQAHRVDAVVSKNSGGALTEAKLVAARELRLPVVMIRRPPVPEHVPVAESAADAASWLRGLALER